MRLRLRSAAGSVLPPLALVALAVLAGCVQPPPAPDAPEGAPPDFPAIETGSRSGEARTFVVDSTRSTVRALAYRAGALSRLGHDHVFEADTVAGLIVVENRDADNGGGWQVAGDLYLVLSDLDVDAADARAEEGFTSEPDADAREGTRRNMLAAFSAATEPWARTLLRARTESVPGAVTQSVPATVSVRLGGGETDVTIPVAVTLADGVLTAEGSFELRHEELGIEPFSVMGGALAVRDGFDIRFRISATER